MAPEDLGRRSEGQRGERQLVRRSPTGEGGRTEVSLSAVLSADPSAVALAKAEALAKEEARRAKAGGQRSEVGGQPEVKLPDRIELDVTPADATPQGPAFLQNLLKLEAEEMAESLGQAFDQDQEQGKMRRIPELVKEFRAGHRYA